MAGTKVINLRDAPRGWEHDPNYVYIGRAGRGHDGYFGNPFRLNNESERERVLDTFNGWMLGRIQSDPTYAARVTALAGKTLVCFCAPKLCHGAALARAADHMALGLMPPALG